MMSNAPILIAGGGPTGLVLGLWLAKAGVPFRLIDKKAGPGEGSPGGGSSNSELAAVHSSTSISVMTPVVRRASWYPRSWTSTRNCCRDSNVPPQTGGCERCARAGNGRGNVDDLRHPHLPRSSHDLGCVVAEVRVCVDHAASASAGGSMRGKSGGAASMPSAGCSSP